MADDVLEGSRWGVDPRARRALALDQAWTALQQGESSVSLALAEELLDEDPEDLEALTIVAEAAVESGLAPVAVLAARQLLERGQAAQGVSAWALLAACEPQAALEGADAALRLDPEDARAWVVKAHAHDILGDRAASDAAWLRAHGLDGQLAPQPLTLREEEWDSLLIEALSGLASRERARARDVHIQFVDVPRVPDLVAAGSPHPPVPPTTDGVLVRNAGEGPEIRLYRRNILRHARTTAEVVYLLQRVLESELSGPPAGEP